MRPLQICLVDSNTKTRPRVVCVVKKLKVLVKVLYRVSSQLVIVGQQRVLIRRTLVANISSVIRRPCHIVFGNLA